uniref:Protein MEMO1 n=1 Tax=Coccolithus braarudii TaxID=221442 RepID=A0A7S0L3M3_9EUKA|mmetsp:Transcript_1323/g.2839  ORF Transcript_1323/g.2839 Transcript_1323/m.2839 type:complete len:290 (+) Transcript_1323:67-936(+)|eukprot:CAMPEP_0183345458 /NCGR_PEP_ID=MMETSP0164_2-20130417/10874_1 /TAXON_ID=221442 /ORGANISM="Coccolithus pelagicus ssp braarudi, Strain PLY182g" /LENGTH=289 /DNA_ID=CAMNT_0025516597 /DNA_START=67 /DNA_END=936 /DNA_ORIENTATION=-
MKRRPSHAGSWYSHHRDELASQLAGWLTQADECAGAARAVIAPHAGYAFSGPTAAWAYKHIDATAIRRVFVLGPSHHVYMTRCALTKCKTYATPLGEIEIDTAACSKLMASAMFDEMELHVDEDEHSIELHLPYIVQVMQGQPFKLVPILVGALSVQSEQQYGRLLAPLLLDPQNLFVISSDFCHWGRRFRFTHFDRSHRHIFESIEALDRQGMTLIEKQDAAGFAAYQQEFGNTICGRHPIALLLHILQGCTERKHELRFVRYAQSSQVRSMDDSSVSYASAIVWATE